MAHKYVCCAISLCSIQISIAGSFKCSCSDKLSYILLIFIAG